jgi:hypothetical protein
MASLRCPRCSAIVEVQGRQPHCPECNFPYRDSRPGAVNATKRTTTADLPPVGEPQRGRPLGVTVIGALDVLGGVAILAFGLVLARAILPMLATNPQVVQLLRTSFGSVTVVLGAFAIVQGIGVLRGDGWAWTVQVAIAVWSAASDVVRGAGSAVPTIALTALVVWYFLRPAVRRWFGKTPVALPMLGRLPA